MHPRTYDIAIIGAGPVGMTLAGLLARQTKRSVLVVEKRDALSSIPRAIHFDAEALRIWQMIGLHEAIVSETFPSSGLQLRDARGELMLKGKNLTDCGFAASHMFYQPTLEKVLENHLEKSQNVTLLRGFELIHLTEKGQQVEAHLKSSEGERGEKINATFLIGTDGANSFVRKALDLRMHSIPFSGSSLKVDVLVKDGPPQSGLKWHFPDAVVKTCSVKQPIVFVPGYGPHKRWEWVLRKDEIPLSETELERMAEKLIGYFLPKGKWQMDHAVVYHYRSAIAKKWQKNNVFIAGDAAHLMPPFIGQGMCSGIRDAANLAWKLEGVLSGALPPAVLKSYRRERFGHALRLIGLTILTGLFFTTKMVGLLKLAYRLPWVSTLLQQIEFPEEPLRKGIIGNNNRKIRGRLWKQVGVISPEAKHRWSDDWLGSGFNLVVLESGFKNEGAAVRLQSLLASYPSIENTVMVCGGSELPRNKWPLEWQLLPDERGEIEAWMRKMKAEVAIVRPDRYVYDGGKIGEVEKMLKALKDKLGLI